MIGVFEELAAKVEAQGRELMQMQQELAWLKARPNFKQHLTTKEAAEFLSVTDDTLLKYFKQGKIDRIKKGKQNLYTLVSLEAYLKSLHTKPEVMTEKFLRLSA